MNEQTQALLKKANYFLKENTSIHISKKNGWFHNGFIKEISADFLILVDEIEGDMPVFFLEIIDIEKREPKREKGFKK